MMDRTSEPELPAYLPDTVDRALVVLLELEHHDRMTTQEGADLLGIARSTAYRLLKLLEHRGFACQNEYTKAFYLGPSLGRVARAAVQRGEHGASMHRLLEQIVGELDETTHLIGMNDGRAYFLDCVEGSKLLRATSRVGKALCPEESIALDQGRPQGWVVNDAETGRAVSVFVPQQENDEFVALAVTVSAPRERLEDDRIDEVIEVLLSCVNS